MVNNFSFEANAILLPLVGIKIDEGKTSLEVSSAAILRYDKITGYLTGNETKDALLVRGDLKRGLLVVENIANTNNYITFEIFSSHTKLKPVYSNEKLNMKINVKIVANIAEIGGNLSFQNENEKEEIKKDAERALRKRLEYIVKKVQNNYKSNIFSFGNKLESFLVV